MHKVTIEDISRHTGLSRGTVSRALNNRPDISEQTKQRVLDACQLLRYVPSHAARSLATGRRYAVGAVVGDLHGVFGSDLLRGVIGRARSERYAVHVLEYDWDPERALEDLRSLLAERVDGLLLDFTVGTEWIHVVREIGGDKPIVALRPSDGVPWDVLAPDYAESGRLVARYVLRGGTPNILYLHQDTSDGARQRLLGFQEVCRASGLDPEQVTVTIPPEAGNGDRFRPVRERLPELRAIAASDDFLALDIMITCLNAGRRPGQDISIVGQGNESFGLCGQVSLSSVDFAGVEVGQRAMDLVLQRISKLRQDAPQQIFVPPVLRPRGSTRPLD
jgi:LacI family transcriptional regulator